MSSLRRFVPWCLSLLAASAWAAPPAGVVLTEVATDVGQPVSLSEPADGSGRLFVVDRRGKVRIIRDGRLLAAPYLSLAVPTDSEQGLLGLAFATDFATSGVFYLTFSAPLTEPKLGTLPDLVLARFVASNPAADVFQGQRTDVLRLPDLYANHNGGDIHFGPDGYLYMGTGDGGSGDDPNEFAQNLWKKTVGGKSYYLLGKMLRLDVGGTSIASAETCGAAVGSTLQYRIPADNPFVGSTNTCNEIDHYGLRNPWRFSFDRTTNRLYIGDVGQGAWEEVDRVAASARGLDFGWDCKEGHADHEPANCAPGTSFTAPVFDYSHNDGCSITGGHVYRGPDASLDGVYFYGDYCASHLFYAEPDSGHWHAGTPGVSGTPLDTGLDLGSGPVGFGEDLDGRLYALTYGGAVWRIDSDALFANGFD